MSSDAFAWDAANASHLARHRVQPVEAEQVLRGRPVELQFRTAGGEPCWLAAGFTDQGRLLTVVYTVRDGSVRVVTAYDAGRQERIALGKKKRI